jgi:hypothetical protein
MPAQARERGRVITKFGRDTIVPPWVLQLRVSRDARLSAVYLLQYQQFGETSIIERLMDDLGVKLAAARRYLAELSKVGVLEVRRRGKRTLYFLYNPNMIPTDHGDSHCNALNRPTMIPTDHDTTSASAYPPPLSPNMIRRDHGDSHCNALNRPTMIPTDHDSSVVTSNMIPTDHGDSHCNALNRPIMIPTDHVRHDDDGEYHIPSDSLKRIESPSPSSAPPAPTTVTPLVAWLFKKGMGAAREFWALDFDAATADFDRRRADGQSIHHIVRTWRLTPPTPEMIDTIEPPCYTPEWFAWIQVHQPDVAALYKRGGDETYDDDQADDEEDAS